VRTLLVREPDFLPMVKEELSGAVTPLAGWDRLNLPTDRA
jgi:hypothetical protein